MAEIKFCPSCGEKRVANAAFCVACGHAFDSVKQRQSYVWISALALSVAAFAIIRYGVMKPTAATPAPAAAEEGHSHDEPPALLALRERAASGEVAALMDLAEAEIQQSKNDQHYLAMAAQTLEKVVQAYPKHAYVLRLLGHLNYDMGAPQKAIDYYNRYLEIHPEDANVLTDMGTQYLALGQSQQAVLAYERALKAHPDFYYALFNLEKAWHELGDEAKAESYAAKAREVEARSGKHLAPDIQLPRLPEGAPSAPAQSLAAGAAAPAGGYENLVANGVDYGPVKAFFSAHPIIGPKMTSFRVEAGKGIATLSEFPMDRMPPAMKDQLANKINTMLQALDAKAVVEMRDAGNGRVMATYAGKPN